MVSASLLQHQTHQQLSLGYCVALLNMLGSAGFTLASAAYFVPAWASEWVVPFAYGLGSACFTAAGAVSFRELDDDSD